LHGWCCCCCFLRRANFHDLIPAGEEGVHACRVKFALLLVLEIALDRLRAGLDQRNNDVS
jgi:hypothetical protein